MRQKMSCSSYIVRGDEGSEITSLISTTGKAGTAMSKSKTVMF